MRETPLSVHAVQFCFDPAFQRLVCYSYSHSNSLPKKSTIDLINGDLYGKMVDDLVPEVFVERN